MVQVHLGPLRLPWFSSPFASTRGDPRGTAPHSKSQGCLLDGALVLVLRGMPPLRALLRLGAASRSRSRSAERERRARPRNNRFNRGGPTTNRCDCLRISLDVALCLAVLLEAKRGPFGAVAARARLVASAFGGPERPARRSRLRQGGGFQSVAPRTTGAYDCEVDEQTKGPARRSPRARRQPLRRAGKYKRADSPGRERLGTG